MALETSPESPAPVRTVSNLLGEWIGRLGGIWIEGQIAQISRRPGLRTVFVTLRDTDADISLSVVAEVNVVGTVSPPLAEGQRVVVYGRPEFYAVRGQLQIRAHEIRPVGMGALLEELERLRALFQAEGLFAAERKRPIPFLPRRIGLISGRASAALRDVTVNARLRWPAVDFETREVAVQGASAVGAIVEALDSLDREPGIDVIVIARGGGSVEDLLPFSNERLVRAVASSRAPVVSAIGHEQDVPLVDLVADLRASTPTDAAKRIVPDVTEERARIAHLRDRLRHVLSRALQSHTQEVTRMALASRRSIHQRLDRGRADVTHLSARLLALSPAATLERGYAVLLTEDGQAVRDATQVTHGQSLHARVSRGSFDVTVQDLR